MHARVPHFLLICNHHQKMEEEMTRRNFAMFDKMTMTADTAVPLFAFFRKTVKPNTAIVIPSPTGVTPYTFTNSSELVTTAKAMLRVLIFLALCIITSLIFISSIMDSGLGL